MSAAGEQKGYIYIVIKDYNYLDSTLKSLGVRRSGIIIMLPCHTR